MNQVSYGTDWSEATLGVEVVERDVLTLPANERARLGVGLNWSRVGGSLEHIATSLLPVVGLRRGHHEVTFRTSLRTPVAAMPTSAVDIPA